jgi:uncharacterized protein (DUF58 family)
VNAVAGSRSAGAAGNAAGYRQLGEALAAPLPPLLVAAEHVATTVVQGVHGRRRVGQGESFWQFRQFGYGDAPRQIDWRRSARSDRLFIRETEWEAAQSVWFWNDQSASMNYHSDDGLPEKWERATVLNLALMSLLVRGGERIALLDQPERPASGRATLNRIAAIMTNRRTDEADNGIPPAPELPRFGSVILIGDFLAPPEPLLQAARTLAARGVKGFMLQVLDPAEIDMPFQGRRRFLGLEDEGDLLVGRAESLRLGYLKRLAELQDELSTFARHADWHFSVHSTDGPAQPALLGLYTAIADHLDL